MKVGSLFLLAAASVVLAGCATIVSSSEWPVTVHSNPEGRKVTVKDSRGMVVMSGVTPLMLRLKSGGGYFSPASYAIEAEGGGFAQLDASFNGWYAGNIIFGGLIGLLIVDPLTGAMWRLPDTVMVFGGSAAPAPSPGGTPYQ